MDEGGGYYYSVGLQKYVTLVYCGLLLIRTSVSACYINAPWIAHILQIIITTTWLQYGALQFLRSSASRRADNLFDLWGNRNSLDEKRNGKQIWRRIREEISIISLKIMNSEYCCLNLHGESEKISESIFESACGIMKVHSEWKNWITGSQKNYFENWVSRFSNTAFPIIWHQ